MKRFLNFTPLVGLVLLGLMFDFLPSESRTHAYSSSQSDQPPKASRDLAEKVNKGHGSELVRVIIQPATSWDTTLESTIDQAGGSNVRQFRNFRVRVVTLSANAALALSARNDVSYVSLNREVRTLGHVFATTGADAVRTTNGTTTGSPDGTGIGIAVLDSGIDTTHKYFLDNSNTG